MIQPVDWPQLVAEALRRRKTEGLTQQAHADLAGVSKPVIIAFDKGETTLSLGRALAILKVVGLVDRTTQHDAFVASARQRWQDLIATLAKDDPGRHPLGKYEMDYEVEKVENSPPASELLHNLPNIMPAVNMFEWAGLRPFWIPSRPDWQPQIRKEEWQKQFIEEELIEWWHGDVSKHFLPPTTDGTSFWRLSPKGHAFLTRGLREDRPENRHPGRYFDITYPIQWAVAGLLHAAALAVVLRGGNGLIRFNTCYRGLSRRRLVSFADPGDTSFSGIGQSQSDNANLSIETNTEQIGSDLSTLVHRFLSPLYAQFDDFRLDRSLVDLEVARLTPHEN